MDIVSKLLMYRCIDLSIHRIERVLLSIPWHSRIWMLLNEMTYRLSQSYILRTGICYVYQYRIEIHRYHIELHRYRMERHRYWIEIYRYRIEFYRMRIEMYRYRRELYPYRIELYRYRIEI